MIGLAWIFFGGDARVKKLLFFKVNGLHDYLVKKIMPVKFQLQ